MSTENDWNKAVSRIEYDQRARNARLQLEHVERSLVKYDTVKERQSFRLSRLLNLSVSTSGWLIERSALFWHANSSRHSSPAMSLHSAEHESTDSTQPQHPAGSTPLHGLFAIENNLGHSANNTWRDGQ